MPKLHVSCHTTSPVTCDTEHRMSQTDDYGKAHLCTTSKCLADHDRGAKFLVTEIFEKRRRSLKGKGYKVHDDNHIKELGRTRKEQKQLQTTAEYISLHVCVTTQPWLTLWPAMSWDPRHFTDAVFLGSSLGEYAQSGLPPGVLGRKDVISMKGTLLPIFQYPTFLMLPSWTWD